MGKLSRDSGHIRVPDPPHMITGTIAGPAILEVSGGVKLGYVSQGLAAKRAGIKSIILPKLNEKDLEEVPESIKENMDFKFIEKMDEAINISLTTH